MRKRGSASVLAMIFLVVFGALSCAFYVMINTSMQVGRNDRNSVRARSAAESGMEVVKHHLSLIKMPDSTPDGEVLRIINTKLNELMGTSPDRTDPSTGFVLQDSYKLAYPELKLNPAHGAFQQPRTFLASLAGESKTNGLRILAAVDGYDRQSKLSRSMAAVFYARPAGRGIFDYDLASAGPIHIENASIVGSGRNGRANVMSAAMSNPAITIENSTISGGLAVVISEDQVEVGDRGQVLVNGSEIEADIMNAVNLTDPPVIPEFDTKPFLDLIGGASAIKVAPNTIKNGTVLTDRVISSSAAATSISGDVTLNGIIYVESPNRLTFRGKLTLNGIIVFGPPRDGRYCGDSLVFGANVVQNPNAAQLHPEASGFTILAPTADVGLAGSASIQAEGSIVCYTFSAEDSGFDLNVNNGTILTLSEGNPSMVLGQGDITFTRTKDIPPTTGVHYYRQYVMDPKTYEERFQ